MVKEEEEEEEGSDTSCRTRVVSLTLMDNTGNAGLYTGAILMEQPHGEGTMVYQEYIYQGQWVNGDWSGFGKLTTSDGDVYQGGFFDNMKHGLGVMQYKDGRIYDGTFQFNCMDGKGHLTMKDAGIKYWGHWNKDGTPHGRGKQEWIDGKVYDGEFENGILQGHGRMTDADGTWYLGEWSDGQPNGLGLQVMEDGTLVFEGMYANGKPIEASSFPHLQKSSGRFLLYRSSEVAGQGTLVGPLPTQVCMRKRNIKWML
jgi:hypothetical protein